MLPILYSQNTSNDGFNRNGLGFIKNTINCVVTEERNGRFELKATVLNSDRLASQIAPLMYIKAKSCVSADPQIFEIYKVEKNDETTTISAQHIRYRMSANVLTEKYLPSSPSTPEATWRDIASLLAYNNTEFTFSSDIETAYIVTAAAESPVRLGDFLLGVNGSMLDTWGGEFEFNNFNVIFHEQRGEETGICLRAGKSVSGMSYEVNTDGMFSDISAFARFPYVNTATKEMLGEIFVDLPDPVDTGNTVLTRPRALSYDFSEMIAVRYPSFVVETTTGAYPTQTSYADAQARLAAVTNAYIRANTDRLRYPQINIDIDIFDGAEELQSANLCDIIQIYYEPLNVNVSAKVVKLEYDVLAEKNVNLELGSLRGGMSQYFSTTALFGGK